MAIEAPYPDLLEHLTTSLRIKFDLSQVLLRYEGEEPLEGDPPHFWILQFLLKSESTQVTNWKTTDWCSDVLRSQLCKPVLRYVVCHTARKYLVDLFLDENFTERWGTWDMRDNMGWTMRLQLLKPKSQDHFMHLHANWSRHCLEEQKFQAYQCHRFPCMIRCTTTMVFTANCCSFWVAVWIGF